ncbi:L-seryl-tRNA(Sec) selenium transferase [Tissierella sp. Yu-01]|uniref:L-seryl-tRNA(Sec) selenium transferase n=1 Tax=Tissierella sp. Yu-01 TaxID=3035694 RepID=UPI00240D3973|nr:L-seryl-tRNA(Sec) selenium transferase [Tissierella sp. Yu-01]WFA09512.1 L-seryl-tRNA(Sec) selenium transferase [Tissierella sp. Yu-01]
MGNMNLFKLLPKVDELLGRDEINNLMLTVPRQLILEAIREEIEVLREKIKNNIIEEELLEVLSTLDVKIINNAKNKNSFKLKRVINATGVVIHTNLGRSIINEKIMDNIKDVVIHYSNLEFDLLNGSRGSRYSHVEEIITKCTGAEAAMVVNNNAAAVLLTLNTIANNKDVVVSRGELIEIGGSFRIPDVMVQSGANLVEVGTTNKTHLFDYENAINENTAALLKVHTSNYRVLGFTSSVSSEELTELKSTYDLPIIEDLGSGVLLDLSKYGLEYEPTVQDSIIKGVDIVTFSGDKLLGGPQAGIIVGKKKYIDAMKKNPLTRAFRVDKFTLAALEGTLKYYLDENIVIKEIPTIRMLTEDVETIYSKAIYLKSLIDEVALDFIDVSIEDEFSEVGGGSLPLEKIATKCVVLSINGQSVQSFENNLRNYSIPIIARLYKDRVYFDLRTIDDNEISIVADGIKFALDQLKGCE